MATRALNTLISFPTTLSIALSSLYHGKDKRGSIRYPFFPNVKVIHSSLQKLAALRAEADVAVERAEHAEAQNKKYEQDILQKDQEITSLNHRIGVLDAELEKAEAKLKETKAAAMEGEHSKSTNDGLLRKVQLLEEELDAAEKNVKETVEKWVLVNLPSLSSSYVLLGSDR